LEGHIILLYRLVIAKQIFAVRVNARILAVATTPPRPAYHRFFIISCALNFT